MALNFFKLVLYVWVYDVSVHGMYVCICVNVCGHTHHYSE